jgi:hypothetical protein
MPIMFLDAIFQNLAPKKKSDHVMIDFKFCSMHARSNQFDHDFMIPTSSQRSLVQISNFKFVWVVVVETQIEEALKNHIIKALSL